MKPNFSASSRLRRPLVLAATALALPLGAWAQEPVPTVTDDAIVTSEDLTETVVVATKTPIALDQLSPSVSYLSGGELRSRQFYSVGDALSHLPGTSVVTTGQNGGQTSLFIRGMESNHTLVLLNGRRLAPNLAGTYNLELLDTTFLDSAQLARGPVSSLYGSDAVAGALDLRMVDARRLTNTDAGVHGELFGEAGSFNSYRGGGQLTLAEGPLGGVVDVSYFDTENDRPNSDFQNLNIRSNIALELAEGVYIDLLGYYQDSQLGAAGSSLSPGFPDRQRNDNQAWMLSPRLTIERDAWDFSLFYSHNDSELTATQAPFFSDSLLEQNSDEIEAQFNLRPVDGAEFTLGAGYYEYEFNRTPLVSSPFNSPADKSYSYGSVFGQANVDLPANFNLLVSGRWDEHQDFDSKGTYSVQLSHDLEATGTRLFGKYATGYKAPSGQDYVFLDPSVDPDSLTPEESKSWELGVRQKLPAEIGSLSVVYFHNDIENLNDSIGFPAFPTDVDTETEGFEFGLDLTPIEGFTIYANYTLLDATITRGQYLDGFGGGPGDRLIRRPEQSLAVGARYDYGELWSLGAEVRGYYDRLDAPGVVLGDATVARIYGNVNVIPGVEVFGRVENVFDEEYESTAGYEGLGVGAYAGLRIRF